MTDTIPRLELPKRWELLSQRAAEAGLDVTQFVERVDAAAEHIDELLERVRTGGGGLFEVIFGLSGSGRTTFLTTLPKFFTELQVHSFASELDLSNLPEFVRGTHVTGDDHSRIVLIERRDIPKKKELEQIEEVFADLLDTFREPRGRVLVLWPITNAHSAEFIAETAWNTGRDSMVDPTTKGRFVFRGVPKERYFALADTTARNLTGDGLEAFGVDRTVSNGLLKNCETIADFFFQVDKVASEKRVYSVLKARRTSEALDFAARR